MKISWMVNGGVEGAFDTFVLLRFVKIRLILSIIPSFSLVFKIGLVFRLIGSHLISHLALRQSQSMIPSLHSLLSPVVYPKVFPRFHTSFKLSQKIPSNTICTLMTPSFTSLSLLQILLHLLKHLPTLSLTFFPG